jgi:hypothetical protein
MSGQTGPNESNAQTYGSWREPVYSTSSLPTTQHVETLITDSSGEESDVDEIDGISHVEMPMTPFRRNSLHPDILQNRPLVLRKVSNASIHLFDRKEPLSDTVSHISLQSGDKPFATRGKRSNSIGSGLMALDIMEPEPPWMSKLTLCSPRSKPRSVPRPNRIHLLVAEEAHAVEREIALEREVQVILNSELQEDKEVEMVVETSTLAEPLSTAPLPPIVTPDGLAVDSTDEESLDLPAFPNSVSSYSSYSSNDSMDVRPQPERRVRHKLKQRLSFPHCNLHSTLGYNMLIPEDDAISPTSSPAMPSFSIPNSHLRPTYRGIKRSANNMDSSSRGNTPPPFDGRSASSSTMSSPNLGYQRSHPYAKRHHRTGSGQWTGPTSLPPSISRSKPMSIPITMEGSKSPGTPPPMDALMGSPQSHGYASPRFGQHVQMAPGAMLNLTEAQEVLARTSINRPEDS